MRNLWGREDSIMLGPITTIIGVIGVVGILFFFANQLDKEYSILRLLVILFGVTLLLLVPKAMIDSQTVCETVVANSTKVSASITSYEYEDFCYQRTENTPVIFMRVLGTFYSLLFTYILLYTLWFSTKELRRKIFRRGK